MGLHAIPGNLYGTRLFLFSIQNETMKGAYNAVCPDPVTNKEMTKVLAKTLSRPLILPNVPGFVLRLLLGEMASIALTGLTVSSEKIEKQGFHFDYPKIEAALQNLYS